MSTRQRFSISIVVGLALILGLVLLISLEGSDGIAYASDIISSITNTTWNYNGKLASQNYLINYFDGYDDTYISSITYYDSGMQEISEPKDVGTYFFTITFTDTSTYGPTQITINTAEVTVELRDKEYTYGDAYSTDIFEIDYLGIAEGEDESVFTNQGTITCAYSLYDPIGEYDASISGFSADNYTFTYINDGNATLKVLPAPVTITIHNKWSIYGNAIVPLTGQIFSGTIYNDDEVYELNSTVTSSSPVDIYDIIGTAINNNYAVSFRNSNGSNHPGTYVIQERYITITIDSKSSQYGDTPQELTYTVTAGSLVATDEVPFVLSCEVTANTDIGGYDILGQETGNDNYVITFQNESESYTVTKRELEITVDNQEGYYGNSQVNLSYTITSGSIYNNQDIISLTSGVGNTTVPGTYPIYGQLKDNAYKDNYNVAFTNGTYTVNPRPITVIINNKSSVYGNSLASLDASAAQNTPLVNGDSMDDLVSLEIQNMTNEIVGEYPIYGTDISEKYTITFENGLYTITPRLANIIIYSHTTEYGTALEELTSDYEGILPQDETLNIYSIHCGVTTSHNVGTYTITASSNSQNYSVAYNPATYTITPKDATVTINNKTSIYGEDIVILTSTSTGILDADKPFAYKVLCDVSNTSDVGDYVISGSALTSNYNITFTNGIYKITPLGVTVTIQNKTSQYGDTIATLTATDDGILDQDIGTAYTLDCAATQGSQIGVYPITGTTVSGNYEITFVDGEYTVTQKVIELSWSNVEFVYDGTEKAPTVQYSGVLASDIINLRVTGAQTNAGEYTASVEIDPNPNYSLPNNAEVQFIIAKAAPKFDLTNVVKTFEYDGFNHSVYGITGTGAITYKNNSFKEIGKYTVIVRCAASDNYFSGETSVTAEITAPKDVEVVDNNDSKNTNAKSAEQLLQEKEVKESKIMGIVIWAIAGTALLAMVLAIIVFKTKKK